jgi:hypothetical protein
MGAACARESARSPSPDLRPSKPLQAQAKHFQICGVFLQIFPKIPSSISWKIRDLQAEKGIFVFLQIFAPVCRRKPAPSLAGKAAGRRTFEE